MFLNPTELDMQTNAEEPQIFTVQILTSQFESINGEKAASEGVRGVGGFVQYRRQNDPSSPAEKTKSYEIFVIHPLFFLFWEESRHISLVVNSTSCNHKTI